MSEMGEFSVMDDRLEAIQLCRQTDCLLKQRVPIRVMMAFETLKLRVKAK